MYLHLGQDTVVTFDEIVGIFDMDNTTVSRSTVDFLNRAEKRGDLVNVTYELPKSFVVCNKGDKSRVYLSQLASSTLLKRANNFLL